jgi:hypothetical protein
MSFSDECDIDTTLVQLAFNNSEEATFVDSSSYDKACPQKNDPLPGRGAF